METIQLNAVTLLPANSKLHAIENLKNSIKRFGFRGAIVVSKQSRTVIAGNGRVKALRSLQADGGPAPEGITVDKQGQWWIPADIRELTTSEEYALATAMNRIQDLGGEDERALLEVIMKYSDEADLMEASGVTNEELLAMIERFGAAPAPAESGELEDVPETEPVPLVDAEPETDKLDELAAKWKVTIGDSWRIGSHRLVCGDSRKPEVVEKVFGDNVKPNLMITDPPYGVDYDPNWRNEAERADGTPIGASAIGEVENDTNADWTETWKNFPGDVVYCWHAGRFASVVEQSLVAAGFEIRSQIIWAKSNFAISRGHYHWKHEPCWYAVRKGSQASWIGDRSQTTLWPIDKPMKNETGHSTQKPLECMARPMRNHAGDVFEPFAGSGTTMVAAENFGRVCYAIEISEKYCAVILERMATAFPDLMIYRES